MSNDKPSWQKARKKPVVIEFREVQGVEHIVTREGVVVAKQGVDYIIRGVDGELYPIKKDIFHRTYQFHDPHILQLAQRRHNENVQHVRDSQLERPLLEALLVATTSSDSDSPFIDVQVTLGSDFHAELCRRSGDPIEPAKPPFVIFTFHRIGLQLFLYSFIIFHKP